MSYSSILLQRAKKELLEALKWYEDRQSGLGDRFKAEVYKRINAIEQTPERYPQKSPPYHETGVDVFPYLIIYRIDKSKKIIVISSIFHASRDPKKKYKK